MTTRSLRFGISIGGSPQWPEFVETVKRAEAAGFGVVATADHISSRHATFPLLAAAAAISSMRVSPMVIANDYRHPVVVARDSATLDVLSEGRFELGIGTGWIESQYRAAGLDYDDPGTRVDRFEEAIRVIRGCWSGHPFSFQGKHYQINELTATKPHQSPHPPLLIAGAGRRMLTSAGREAGIIGISPLGGRRISGLGDFGPAMGSSGDRIEAQLRWIAEAAGDRFEAIELSVMAHHLDTDPDFAGSADRLAGEWGVTAAQVLESPHVFLGEASRLADLIEERRERLGVSYYVFASSNLPDVEKVVSRLAGT